MAASLIQRGPMRSRRLHLRDFNLRSGAANLQRPPNKRLEKDLRPARYARWVSPSQPDTLGNKIAIREQSDMLARMDLDTQRQFYAEEIRAVANLQSEVL